MVRPGPKEWPSLGSIEPEPSSHRIWGCSIASRAASRHLSPAKEAAKCHLRAQTRACHPIARTAWLSGAASPRPTCSPAPRSPFRPLTSVLQGRTSSGPGDSTLNCTDLPVFPRSVSPAGTHVPRGADSYLFLHPSISSKPRRLSTRPCSKRMRSPCPETERLRTGMARTSPRYRKGNPSYRGRGRAPGEHAAPRHGPEWASRGQRHFCPARRLAPLLRG